MLKKFSLILSVAAALGLGIVASADAKGHGGSHGGDHHGGGHRGGGHGGETSIEVSTSIAVCTSIGTCACTIVDRPTNATSSAERTMATFGSATVDTFGTAVGMPTVWVLAGFI